MSSNLATLPPSTPVKRALGWIVSGSVISQLLRFGSSLILTRLLIPDAFALMLLAASVLTIVTLLSDVGVTQVVLRSERIRDTAFLDTAWTVQILKGLFIALCVVVVALVVIWLRSIGWIPTHGTFADRQLPPVLMVLALAPVLTGFQSISAVLAIRFLNQKPLFVIEIIAQLCGFALAAIWASIHPSVWALVASWLFSSFVSTLLGYMILPRSTNRFRLETAATTELFVFGKWLWLSSLIGVVGGQIDKLLFGAVAPPTWLGQMAIALSIVAAVEGIFAKAITGLALPRLAEALHLNITSAREKYLNFLSLSERASFFVVGVLVSISHTLIAILYPAKFHGAAEILMVVATNLLLIRGIVFTQWCLVIGKVNIQAFLSITRLIVCTLCIFLGQYYGGVRGALLGLGVQNVLMYLVLLRLDALNGFNPLHKIVYSIAFFALGVVLGRVVIVVQSVLAN